MTSYQIWKRGYQISMAATAAMEIWERCYQISMAATAAMEIWERGYQISMAATAAMEIWERGYMGQTRRPRRREDHRGLGGPGGEAPRVSRGVRGGAAPPLSTEEDTGPQAAFALWASYLFKKFVPGSELQVFLEEM